MLAAGYGGAVALHGSIKVIVGRPRPPLATAVHHFSDCSFPSGHATQAIVAWGMRAPLVAAAMPRWSAKVAWATALLIAVLVAASRLYFGAHFTDVVGGLVQGALWLSALLILTHAVPVPVLRPGGRPGGDGSPLLGPDETATAQP